MEYTIRPNYLTNEGYHIEITPALGETITRNVVSNLSPRSSQDDSSPVRRVLVLREEKTRTALLARPGLKAAEETVLSHVIDGLDRELVVRGGNEITIQHRAPAINEQGVSMGEIAATYQRACHMLVNYVFWKFNDLPTAEDATQEVYCYLLRHRESYAEIPGSTWLRTAGRRTALKLYERRREQLTLGGELPEVSYTTDEGYRDLLRIVDEAIPFLPARLQEIAAKILEDKSNEQISRELGIQVNTVHQHRMRLRRLMKPLLEQD